MADVLSADGCVEVRCLTAWDEIQTLLKLFAEVADEQSWQPGNQLRVDEPGSLYFTVMSYTTLAGGLQLVLGRSTALFPCQSVWPELPIQNREEAAEIALVALSKPFRGTYLLFWLLCIEAWRYCRSTGIREVWLEVTPTNLLCYQRLGLPLEVAGPLRAHWGEDCYPCRIDIAEALDSLQQKAERSSFYRELVSFARRDDQPALSVDRSARQVRP